MSNIEAEHRHCKTCGVDHVYGIQVRTTAILKHSTGWIVLFLKVLLQAIKNIAFGCAMAWK